MAGHAERVLRKGMTHLGHLVESLIGQAKKAKVTYETRVGLQPILSLESRLAPAKIRQLMDTATDRMLLPLLPPLKDKNALEVGEGPLHFISVFSERKAKNSYGIAVGEGKTSAGPLPPGAFVSKGQLRNLPFDSQSCDVVVARLSTPLQSDVVGPVKEVGRVLSPDGNAVIVDYHPFGLFAKTGPVRMRGVEATIRGLEDYYKMCRVAGLQLTEAKDIFIDENHRTLFTTAEELAAFRDLKGTPLLICLFAVKTRRNN